MAEAFVAAGHPLYLVGGVVRDLLLGRDRGASTDIDLCTPAHPGEVKAIVDHAYQTARTTLQDNIDKLKLVAETLIELETLTAEEFNTLWDSDGDVETLPPPAPQPLPTRPPERRREESRSSGPQTTPPPNPAPSPA